ncbi:MAG TPA: esterase-like activity of phytase family protein [Acidimicrobiales bacterium]|nr:esterase-like activity of phytase family protein [Acidimicrobiales bacterium]
MQGVLRRVRVLLLPAAVALVAATAGPVAGASEAAPRPALEGRAVLPVETYAPGPPAGSFFAPNGPVVINGITFPLPSQPVEGFSAVVAGRHPGEFLAMPDNGFGSKASSRDFLIRAYYVQPDFKTAQGGTGAVAVGDFVQFRDPNGLIGFPIVREGTPDRLLTGGDVDPESLQRGVAGDYWMGEEFGPWILHFGADGVLLHAPFALPDGIMSPNNPHLDGQPPTQPNSRGIEAMGLSPDGMHLYAALEGATNADPDRSRRRVFEFSTADERFTGREWAYGTEAPAYLVADMWALDQNRFVVIERDGGLGTTALFRRLYVVDLRDVGADGVLGKRLAVDLHAIPDPDLVSLPAVHPGDIGLGDPFSVVCESIEAVHVLDGERVLLACDNNFPNKGRNPDLADDDELIVVRVPGLKAATDGRTS